MIIKASHIKAIGLFLGGVLFGTAGIKILSSRDAKKAYVHCTAAALRAKAVSYTHLDVYKRQRFGGHICRFINKNTAPAGWCAILIIYLS